MRNLHSGLHPQRLHRSNPARSKVILRTDASDVDLVHRTQLGEQEAFDLLVLKYQRRILKLALRYTRNLSDAEDVCQEAFIKAYRGLRGFRGECTFYTWLHRIAINAANSALKVRARESEYRCVISDGDSAPELAACLWELETPEDLALTNDIRLAVNAALEALPATHRMAIMSREIDRLTYEQIATAMETPIGTVRSRVFRARELIDQRLRMVFDGGLGRGTRRRSRLPGTA
jgi:RNA polymerase sigma-70 factor, ECF subfamily